MQQQIKVYLESIINKKNGLWYTCKTVDFSAFFKVPSSCSCQWVSLELKVFNIFKSYVFCFKIHTWHSRIHFILLELFNCYRTVTRSALSTSQKHTPVAEGVREICISSSPRIWRHNDIIHLLQNHREDCSDLKNNSLKLVSESCFCIWMGNSQLMALCIMSANMITCF